ncbi:MAG: sugar phosphate nucleotidyltransferase, partial [Woeseiaceae bacterium]
MIAMILAAGRGERLRPITDEMPKALVEVDGESLLERHLRFLAEVNISTVVINLGWLGERIVERIGCGSQFGLQVVYSPEFDGVLETGGGIRRALPLLGKKPFWVINADTYTEFQL